VSSGQARPCDLCAAQRVTTWYVEDDSCWVADCEICGVPMAVWRTHGVDPPSEVREHLLAVLAQIARGRFGAEGYVLDERMRNIPDHYHVHARDARPLGMVAR